EAGIGRAGEIAAALPERIVAGAVEGHQQQLSRVCRLRSRGKRGKEEAKGKGKGKTTGHGHRDSTDRRSFSMANAAKLGRGWQFYDFAATSGAEFKQGTLNHATARHQPDTVLRHSPRPRGRTRLARLGDRLEGRAGVETRLFARQHRDAGGGHLRFR